MKFDTEVHQLVKSTAHLRIGIIQHETLSKTIIDYLNPDNEDSLRRFGSSAKSKDTVVANTATARDTCGDGTDSFVLETPNIKWPSSKFPIPYTIDTTNITIGLDTAAAIQAIDSAFATYNAELNTTMFIKGTDVNTSPVTVHFAPIDGAFGTVAYCNYTWNDNYDIVKADIVFDSSEIWFVSDVQRCGFFGAALDLQNVLTHEIGHGVGLAHCPTDSLATMYPTVMTGETLRRTLSIGDAKGFHTIYGPAKPTYPNELDYGPIILNGTYNTPYQIISIANVGNVAFRTAFISAVIDAGYGKTRASWYLHYTPTTNLWSKVTLPP